MSEDKTPLTSGYFAVIVTNHGEFKILGRADHARAYHPLALWIFGKPSTPEERALQRVIEPMAVIMDEQKVERRSASEFVNA